MGLISDDVDGKIEYVALTLGSLRLWARWVEQKVSGDSGQHFRVQASPFAVLPEQAWAWESLDFLVAGGAGGGALGTSAGE
jgi:hypothetical protein